MTKRLLHILTCSSLVCYALLAAWSSSASADKIKAIEIANNTKTTDETVLLIARVEVGDDFAPEDVARVTSALKASGLFNEDKVAVFTTPMIGGVKLTILAKDKHSWIIAPTVYNQPTNKGGGVGFGENNLFGTNKKLLLYGQIATGDSFFLGAYVDPAIKGSRFRWGYDVFLRRERLIEYAVPQKFKGDTLPVRQSKLNYLNSGLRIGMNVFGKFFLDVRARGANVFYDDVKLAEDATLADVTPDPMATVVPNPGREGWDLSTEVILQKNTRASWLGISEGDIYQVAYETSLDGLGSDFSYWYTTVSYLRARRFYKKHNWIIRGQFAYGKNVPVQHEFTSGGVRLRGYKNDQMRGNVMGVVNAEYSLPLFAIKGFGVRALAFWDTSYTAFVNTGRNMSRNYLPRHEHKGLAPFKNSVGIGTRVFARSIILPLLGVDVGYGLERGAFEVYLAIGLTDF